MRKNSIVLFAALFCFVFFLSLGAQQKGDNQGSANAEKILGAETTSQELDDSEKELGIPVQYPTNSSLGYKGVVLAAVNPTNDANNIDEVICDFGSNGVWVREFLPGNYGGSWYQLSGANPDAIIAARFPSATDWEIVADFGTLGVWKWDYNGYPGNWYQLSGVNAEGLVAVDDDNDSWQEIQVDFGSLGLWRYDDVAGGVGTWTQLSGVNAYYGLKMDTVLLGYEEGCWILPTYGVWRLWWSGGPVLEQLTGTATYGDDHASAKFIGGAAEDLILDFEELGIWLLQNNNHSWQKLHDFSPNRVREVQFGGGNYELLVDFNSEAGLWVWSYGGSYPGTFTEILADANPGVGFCEPFDPDGNTESATIDEEVAIDREANGLWLYNSTGGTWTQLSAKNPVFMVRGDVFNDLYKTALVIDFATDGLWLYDGRFNNWWQISGLSPDGGY